MVVVSFLKNTYFIVFSIVLLSILVALIFFYIFIKSSLKLNGNKNITISYNEKYVEKGAYIKYSKKLSDKIIVEGKVDNKIGKYILKYKLNFLFFNIYKVRTVNVVDTEKPVIELEGNTNVYVCPDEEYNEEGYKAYDEYDLDLTDKVKVIKDKDNNYLYEVSDSSKNIAVEKRKINYEDKENPTISLIGSSNVYVKVNSSYDDLGYEVSDNCKGVNVEKDTNLDLTREGKYYITYKAIDSSSNESSVTRTINVYKEGGLGVIYLTFDDGPSNSGTTRQILDILASEGVKATFFVTGSGSDEYIREEYNSGHSVALHTYTHNYGEVYSSVDAYFYDLSRVEERVYNIIGIRPKVIRFPGGSNNTVSNRYSSGIMFTLRSEVLNRGYTYFDWNVSSNDAGGCTTSNCVYNNVVNNLSKSRSNIVLMHDIKWTTTGALKDIIKYGKENGYSFKTITEETSPVRFN